LIEVELSPAAFGKVDDEGRRAVDFGNFVENIEGMEFTVFVDEKS